MLKIVDGYETSSVEGIMWYILGDDSNGGFVITSPRLKCTLDNTTPFQLLKRRERIC